jgi:hypothetical protein
VAADYYGCTSTVKFILHELPFTEMECEEGVNMTLILFAGFIATTVSSIALFLLSTGLVRYFASMSFSIGLIAASKDFGVLPVGTWLVFLINVAGYLLFSFVVIKIVLSSLKETCMLRRD